jgi:hypothetical protein
LASSEAVELVVRYAREVDYLARWLLAKGRLDGEDVHVWWDGRSQV